MASANQTYPVQCQDDPYPSNGVVVSGEMSYPLHGCTPQMTGYWIYIIRAVVIHAENSNADNALGSRYGHEGTGLSPWREMDLMRKRRSFL